MNANKLLVLPFNTITKACGIHEQEIERLGLICTDDMTPAESHRLQTHKDLLAQCQHTAGRRFAIELMMADKTPRPPVAPLRAR